MKKILLKQFLLFVFLIFTNNVYSQQTEKIPAKNVTAKQEENKVIINYDLEGPQEIKYTVFVYLVKVSDENFKIKLKNLKGDMEGKLSGTNREIIWDYNKDMNEKIVPVDILGQDIKFYVEAEYLKPSVTDTVKSTEKDIKPDGGTPIWYYIGGAVLVGGGVTAYILSRPNNGENNFPKPPGKPQ
jgi:hypothetical protein